MYVYHIDDDHPGFTLQLLSRMTWSEYDPFSHTRCYQNTDTQPSDIGYPVSLTYGA